MAGAETTLLRRRKVHYNSCVNRMVILRSRILPVCAVVALLLVCALTSDAQQPANPPLTSGAAANGASANPANANVPAATGARILLLPRQLVSGERSTLAVLDVNGRLTPDVTVVFSNGEKVKTDTSGRALFVAPLNLRTIYAGIEGRTGKAVSTILSSSEAPSASQQILTVPRVATLSDRFTITGLGFCGDADANHVSIGGFPALVLASSPVYLAVLPPLELNPGPAKVQVSCGQRVSTEFTVVFVNLELEANGAALAPKEHRTLSVRVRGSTARIYLEAHNLAPEIAELQGATKLSGTAQSATMQGTTTQTGTGQGATTQSGMTVKVLSSGGENNIAQFQISGKQRGNFMVSIRLVAPASSPRFESK